jgi:serine/threonine-protein kinase
MADPTGEDAATLSLPSCSGGAALPDVLAGRYQILETIGEGGMGIVCRGFDLDLEETVAIKLLRGDLARDDGLRARFRREVKLARRVTHPNVARVFEFGRDGPHHFLTMEFVPGESLQALLLREAPLDPARVLDLALGLCEGLAAAHAAGVVHGDIKPGNVLVAPGRGAVVTDFGIAQALGEAAHGAGSPSGTPLYMAPEQARGEGLGPQTDVYAVGVVLFAALTGAAPWPTGDVTGLILRKRRGHEPDLSRLAPGLGDEWRAVIAECLRGAQDRRPADARALLERLSPLRGAGPRAPARAEATPLATGEGPRWIAVAPLSGPAQLAWIGADLVDALAQTRGVRVLSGEAAATAPRGAARVEVAVRPTADGVGVALRVREGEVVRATIEAEQPRAAWHRLGGELAARIAAAVDRGAEPPERRDVLDDAVSELYVRARQAHLAMHYEQSVKLFEAALARAPGNRLLRTGYTLARVQATLLRGECEAGELAALRASVDEVVAESAGLGEAHLLRARIAYGFSEHGECARSLRAAIARAPSLIEAHSLLAELLLEIGRLPDAERRLDIALTLDRGSVHAWHVRTRLLAYQGRWDEIREVVIPTLTALKARSPVLARVLLWCGDRPALAALERAFEDNLDGLPRRLQMSGVMLVRFGLGRAGPEPIELAASTFLHSSHRHYNCLYKQVLTEVHALAGNRERAFEQLAGSVDRDGLVDWQWIEHCPALAPLRDDPRFERAREVVRARADALAEAIWG